MRLPLPPRPTPRTTELGLVQVRRCAALDFPRADASGDAVLRSCEGRHWLFSGCRGRSPRIRPRAVLSSVPPSCGGSIPARRRVAACATPDETTGPMAPVSEWLALLRRAQSGAPGAFREDAAVVEAQRPIARLHPAPPGWRAHHRRSRRCGNEDQARGLAASAMAARRLIARPPAWGHDHSRVSLVVPAVWMSPFHCVSCSRTPVKL